MENKEHIEFVQDVKQMLSGILSEVNSNTSGKYIFKKDIKTGEKGEVFVTNFLINMGFVLLEENKDFRYDRKMSYNGVEITYEIKTDVYTSPERDSGNMAIELESRGGSSGIDVTEANYFVTYYPKLREIWNIKTDELKKLIGENSFRIAIGGDKGSNTKMHLIPRESFKEYFNVYKV